MKSYLSHESYHVLGYDKLLNFTNTISITEPKCLVVFAGCSQLHHAGDIEIVLSYN